MLLTMRLWLCLLDAGWADRMADNLAGFRNEYRVVLGAGLLAVVLAFESRSKQLGGGMSRRCARSARSLSSPTRFRGGS